jgi:pyridoxal phosphate enzyme (YggS family)
MGRADQMNETVGAADIAANLSQVRADIAAAARSAGRDPQAVTLIAVGKTHAGTAIEHALAAGQSVFGENRVQEAAGKYPPLRDRHPALELHLIGPLQTNKVRDAVRLFDAIHTLDRPKLAVALAAQFAHRAPSDRVPELFIQVNTGEEPQKAGVLPGDADAFIETCQRSHGLIVAGLMCIPPADDDPAPHFALLREMARRHGLGKLSMGMSADYPIAIQLGATHVRVGTAIFGRRPALKDALS